jgi:hypothetical protein
MYFSLFIQDTDVIFRQISKYGPHVTVIGSMTQVLHFNTQEAVKSLEANFPDVSVH